MSNARPPFAEEPSATNPQKCKRVCQLTPRQRRLLAALLNRPQILREEVDRITGASNGPQIVAEMRHHWQVEIVMERVDRLDRDGRPCKPGIYSITEAGRARASELLGDGNG